MSKVIAGITRSVDGYITGPDDGRAPGSARAVNGCTTGCSAGRGAATPSRPARWTRTTRRGWTGTWLPSAPSSPGGRPPRRLTTGVTKTLGGVRSFIVTHRLEQPEGDAFRFVAGLPEAIEQAGRGLGDKDVHLMGGAATSSRQGLAAGLVDELTIILAPVILGAGKRAAWSRSTCRSPERRRALEPR